MSLIYKRKGHERTNAQGTTFWVSEHKVKKDFYSVRTENGQVVINGITKLLLGSCHNCRGTVFYADISSNKRIFFSNNTEPLIRHDCRQKQAKVEHVGPLKKQKKFMSDDQVAAQEEAKKKGMLTGSSNTPPKYKYSEKTVLKLLNEVNKIVDEISKAKHEKHKLQLIKQYESKKSALEKYLGANMKYLIKDEYLKNKRSNSLSVSKTEGRSKNELSKKSKSVKRHLSNKTNEEVKLHNLKNKLTIVKKSQELAPARTKKYYEGQIRKINKEIKSLLNKKTLIKNRGSTRQSEP